MKTIAPRKAGMVLGGILIATVAAGCFGGGHGYSNDPYGYNSGYNSNYSSYGSSYPYSGYSNGYSYPQNYGNSYSEGYQNGARADENRDRHQEAVHDRGEGQHSGGDHDKYSRKDSENHSDRN
jgi:hypothetical protein